MHRSSSMTRASDFFIHGGFSSSSSSPSVRPSWTMPDLGDQKQRDDDDDDVALPLYDPQSDFARKEKGRARFSESVVHFIPLVLVISGFVLWFFSTSDSGYEQRSQ